jgi:hypothetical protein
MELLRYARSVWGQQTLIGASWDPLWVFVAAGAAFIVVHALYKAVAGTKRPGAAAARTATSE